MTGLDSFPLFELKIDANAAGDNILIPAVGQSTIRVFKLFIVLGGDTDLTFRDGLGGTTLDGPLSMLAHGSIVLDFDGEHWFITSPANDFVLNSTNAVQISGRIYYTQTTAFQAQP